jgi:hypothetical protein
LTLTNFAINSRAARNGSRSYSRCFRSGSRIPRPDRWRFGRRREGFQDRFSS